MNELTQQEILVLKSLLVNHINLNGRRITNAGRSLNLNDYVIKDELRDLIANLIDGDLTIDGDYFWKSGTAFTGQLAHANSANRVYTFPDAVGNIPSLPNSATTETGTGALVRTNSPTIVTPNVASLTNMQHDHLDGDGGGTLDASAIVTGVLDTALGGVDLTAWTGWTPTYSSDIGDSAATFTGTPTTALARYKVIGKICFITINFTATLNAVTPAYLQLTLPVTPQNSVTFTPSLAIDNNLYTPGLVEATTGADKLRFYKIPIINYTISTVVGAKVSFAIELA